MKKAIALSAALSVFASMSTIAASAESSEAVPANVESAVYEQLFNQYQCDVNEDGVITDEELKALQSIRLSLDGVTDISWLKDMPNLTYISLSGGEITDISVLAEVPNLKNIYLDSVPITDISWLKGMNLETVRLNNMNKITLKQRIEVSKFNDISMKRGYSELAGAFPIGLFDDYTTEIHIENPETVIFDVSSAYSGDDGGSYLINQTSAPVYAENAGSTGYYITINGEKVFSGTINVEEISPLNMEHINKDTEYSSERLQSEYYSSKPVILNDGTLYAINDGKLEICEQNVSDYKTGYYTDKDGSYVSSDIVLLDDGTVKVNGQTVASDAAEIGKNRFIPNDGKLYYFKDENGQIKADYAVSDCKSFISTTNYYYLSSDGEVMLISENNGSYSTYSTGIKNPISSHNDYFVDENKILWEVKRNKNSAPTVTKKAEDAVFVGYRSYSGGTVYGCVHIASDGTAYRVGTTQKVTLCDDEYTKPYIKSGYFFDDSATVNSALSKSNYHITSDNVLTLLYSGETYEIADVADYIGYDYDNDSKSITIYYICTDNSVCSYSIPENKYSLMTAEIPDENIPGDINNDGTFNILDITQMKQYILNGIQPQELKNADMNNDNISDISDFVIMKNNIIK